MEDVKDVVVDLPLGFVGSTVSTPKCTFAQLQSYPKGSPLDTLVGQIVTEPEGALGQTHGVFYYMVPEHGVADEFGFTDALHNTHVIYASLVPTPEGYVVRATAREVPQIELAEAIATFYGDPAVKDEDGEGTVPVAMFTNPSDCTGEPLRTTVYMDSWQNPGKFNSNGTPEGEPEVNGPGWVSKSAESPPVTGCDDLRFNPETFSVLPDIATGGGTSGGDATV